MWLEYWESQGTNKIDVRARMYWDSGLDVSGDLSTYCMSLNNLVAGITANIP